MEAVGQTEAAPVETLQVEPKYGPTEDGGYLTPYQMTIFYNEDSIFETTIATLASRAQMVPLPAAATADYNAVADSCEFITPEVLIFGAAFPPAAIMRFFERGFHFVHIMIGGGGDHFNGEGTLREYQRLRGEPDGTDAEAPASPASPIDEKFSTSVVVFGAEKIYDHVVLVEGLSTLLITELVLLGTFPTYKSVNDNYKREDGLAFLRYVRNTRATRGNLVKTREAVAALVLQLVGSFRGFETIEHIIVGGKAMNEMCEILASRRLDVSPAFMAGGPEGVRSIVCYGDLSHEMMALAPVHPRVVRENIDLIVMYEAVDDPAFMLKVTLFSPRGTVNAGEFMRRHFPALHPRAKHPSHALSSVRVKTGETAGLLPF
jgi:hypothetical protein